VSPLTVKSVYYQTAEFQELKDMVRFFHEAWDHPSRELMIWIVKNNVYANLPAALTGTVIRKHFPPCEACPAANMAQRPRPGTTVPRDIVPGEEIEVDIKIFADCSKARKHKRAFGNYTGAQTAIDLATGFRFGHLLRGHGNLVEKLELLRLEVSSRDRIMKVLRIDNQYVTADIQKWAATTSPGRPAIRLQPCIPHEHHTIGDVERFNRTLEDAVFKKLYG